MSFLRYPVALSLTIILLFIAREIAMVRPHFEQITQNNITIKHTAPAKHYINEGDAPVVAEINSQDGVLLFPKLFYRITSPPNSQSAYSQTEMKPEEENSNFFAGFLPLQTKGTKVYYYLLVENQSGNVLATLPELKNPDFKPISLKFEGKVKPYIIVPHILCMFVSMFFVLLASYKSIDIYRNRGDIKKLAKNVLWATIFVFIGGFPLGILVSQQALGGPGWGGIPLGWDITDNKTLLIFLYWVVLIFLAKGSLFQKDDNKNVINSRSYAGLVLIGFVLVLAMYLIPHSI